MDKTTPTDRVGAGPTSLSLQSLEDLSGAATTIQRERYVRILNAALLTVREHSFRKASVDLIADEAGVGLNTIYRYFGSRDALLFSATNAWLQSTVRPIREGTAHLPPHEAVRESLRRGRETLYAEQRLLEGWALAQLTEDHRVAEQIKGGNLFVELNRITMPTSQYGDLVTALSIAMDNVWTAGTIRWALRQRSWEEICSEMDAVVEYIFDNKSQ